MFIAISVCTLAIVVGLALIHVTFHGFNKYHYVIAYENKHNESIVSHRNGEESLKNGRKSISWKNLYNLQSHVYLQYMQNASFKKTPMQMTKRLMIVFL